MRNIYQYCKNKNLNILAFVLISHLLNVDIAQGHELEEVIVTANRVESASYSVLADYVYIGRDEILNSGQNSVAELLQAQRGVQISTSGSIYGSAEVYLRGAYNQHSLILIDGVRADSPSLGGPLWSSIPLQLIDHIEIIFGPQSTFYGSDAMGGVIQVFTKKTEGDPQVYASTGFGTNRTSSSSASVSGSFGLDSITHYSFGITDSISNGITLAGQNNAYCNVQCPNSASNSRLQGFTGSITQDWSTGQEIGLKSFITQNRYSYPNPGEMDEAINNLFIGAIYSKNLITENWNSKLQLSNATNNSVFINSNSNNPYRTPEYDFNWENNIKFNKNVLQILFERRLQSLTANTTTDQTYAPTSENLNESRAVNSFGLSYQLNYDKNKIIIGFRDDNITNYGSKTSGNVSYGYFFTPNIHSNVSYGTGFHAPTFDDLYYPAYGNPNLAPETNRNFEIALHNEFSDGEIHTSIFKNEIMNLIQTIQPVNNTFPSIYSCPNYDLANGCPVNIGLASIEGISIGGSKSFGPLTFNTSVDVVNSIDKNDPNPGNIGSMLPMVAKDVVHLGVKYSLGKSSVGSTYLYSNVRYGSLGNSEEMAAYSLVNIYANYDVDKNWSYFLNWNNVTNTHYQLNYGFNTATSNVYLGVRYSFK